MELGKAISDRRSIRSYKDTAVSDNQILELLHAASMAPSAKNGQQWKYYVLRGEEKNRVAGLMEKAAEKAGDSPDKSSIEGSCRAIRSSSVLFLVGYRVQSPYLRSDMLSLGASMENMCLKAVDLGLGSLWICDVDIAGESIEKEFGLDAPVIAALAAGYPDEFPDQRPRLPVEEVSEWISDSAERKNIRKTRAVKSSGKYVFISYSHLDKQIVDADIAELKRHGVPIWVDDSMIAGTEWNRVALKRIEDPDCACVIFYLSTNSVLSDPVAKELDAAVKRFGRPEARDKSEAAPVKGFFSVNIGGCSPEEMYRQIKQLSGIRHRIPRQLRRQFTQAFPSNVKYIKRGTGALDSSHIEEMLDVLEMYDIITPGVYDEFTYDVLPSKEILIKKYTGSSERAAVVDRISGLPVAKIGANAFTGSGSLRSVYVPDSVREIDDGAFRDLRLLEDVRLPDTLERLGAAAFRDTPSLKSVRLPGGLKVLEEAMFRGSGVTEVIVPDGVTRLGEAVFLGCKALKRVVIPDSVAEMTEGGFRGCCELEQLTIPRDIKGLQSDSFSDCPKVDAVVGNLHYHDGKADPVQ